jgi:hypothetical protein
MTASGSCDGQKSRCNRQIKKIISNKLRSFPRRMKCNNFRQFSGDSASRAGLGGCPKDGPWIDRLWIIVTGLVAVSAARASINSAAGLWQPVTAFKSFVQYSTIREINMVPGAVGQSRPFKERSVHLHWTHVDITDRSVRTSTQE